MNRFKVSIGKEDQFEIIWKTRKSNLQTVAGFISFNLLRSDTFETYTLMQISDFFLLLDYFYGELIQSCTN